jgi:hypothetical protein
VATPIPNAEDYPDEQGYQDAIDAYVAAGGDALMVLREEFAALNADDASSNDIVQWLDDWLVARGLPTVLYR